ncbi:22622_t:CDS:2 [Entrophospora sp. SA101]|nr:22622_t:CDS:2 [Entrophospora sp. SA101]
MTKKKEVADMDPLYNNLSSEPKNFLDCDRSKPDAFNTGHRHKELEQLCRWLSEVP